MILGFKKYYIIIKRIPKSLDRIISQFIWNKKPLAQKKIKKTKAQGTGCLASVVPSLLCLLCLPSVNLVTLFIF